MNKFEQEAANRKAAEKEARNKARDEALEFVNNYKKENGNKGFISLRIRDGFIGKKLKNGRLQLERNKPRGTLVAIKGDNNDVHIGFTYLSNKDKDIPIVGIAEALKNAILSKNGIGKTYKTKDEDLFKFFEVRAKCFFYPDLYSHSRGTEKLVYPNYDENHMNREKALKFIGREDLI